MIERNPGSVFIAGALATALWAGPAAGPAGIIPPALAQNTGAQDTGAQTVVVPRTSIQVDEGGGKVTVTEQPRVSRPGAGTAAPPRARITKKDCQRVIRHQARADVAYKPGVDARGKAVVPADLGGGTALDLPEVFEFTVTKDLSAFLDGPEERAAAATAAAQAALLNTPAADAAAVAAEEKASKSPELDLNVGTVSVDVKTGAMTFNGKPLNDAAMSDMVVLCRDLLAKGGK